MDLPVHKLNLNSTSRTRSVVLWAVRKNVPLHTDTWLGLEVKL